MQPTESVVVFHTPRTRSTSILFLLEELGVPYELEIFRIQEEDVRQPVRLDQAPSAKSLSIRVRDAQVTGQIAIFLYLADRFPEAHLAPPVSDAERGDYLRWMTDYASAFEPAIADRMPQAYYRKHFDAEFIRRFLKHDIAANRRPLDDDLEALLQQIDDQVSRTPYLLGDRFSAADILWAPALYCTTASGLISPSRAIERYTRRILSRQKCIDVLHQDVLLIEHPRASLQVIPG
ncbi:glutathione S-transferase family protein [Mangrovitalea sediminis]|uniref:glutathione S-transferase family protein n=1 Tax=Mangrovitalea sediminis TaxID=1982043 RepID=UPI0013046B68|nr:glutathione S-transferase family protein [Mangrovitalea sediminis]